MENDTPLKLITEENAPTTPALRLVVTPEEVFEEVDPVHREQMEANLKHALVRRRKRERMALTCTLLYSASIGLGVLTGFLTQLVVWARDYPPIVLLTLLSAWAAIPGLLLWQIGSKDARKAARTLAELNDVRLVGTLVETLRMEDVPTRKAAGGALRKLLPQLKASDAHLLTRQQKAQLCRLLKVPADDILWKDLSDIFLRRPNPLIELQIAILKAFEQVGDARALPVVEALANDTPHKPGQKRVQMAAKECLPFLQARASAENVRLTLLRASEPNPESPQELLRPAQETDEMAPQSLLRPAPPE